MTLSVVNVWAAEPATATVKVALDKSKPFTQCHFPGVTKGLQNFKISTQETDPTTKWIVSVDQNTSIITLTQEALGTIKLRVSIPFNDAVQIQPVASETPLRRLERLTRIAAGTDDTDDQISQAQKRAKAVKQSIKTENDAIKEQETKIADTRKKQADKPLPAGHIQAGTRAKQPNLLSDYIIKNAEDNIKNHRDRIKKLNIEQTAIQKQIRELEDIPVSNQLKIMPPNILAAVNPLILTVEVDGSKIGTIELAIVNPPQPIRPDRQQ